MQSAFPVMDLDLQRNFARVIRHAQAARKAPSYPTGNSGAKLDIHRAPQLSTVPVQRLQQRMEQGEPGAEPVCDRVFFHVLYQRPFARFQL
jgi:hypothetical protein